MLSIQSVLPTTVLPPVLDPPQTPTPIRLEETYIDSEIGYSVDFPSAWGVERTDLGVLLSHPLGSSLAIFVRPLPGGATLEEIAAIFIGHLLSLFTPAEIERYQETSRTRLSDPPRIFFQAQFLATETDPGERLTLHFTVHGEYVLIDLGLVEDFLFELHQPILEQIRDSFALLPPSPPPADDHGNTPGTATEITIDQSVVGAVESQIEIDYFVFSGVAQEWRERNTGRL